MRLTAKKTKKVMLPKDPDKAWVNIIYLKPGVRKMIEQDSNTMTATSIKGEFVPQVELSRKRKRKMFLEEVIDEWGNFFDQHKNELDLNSANVELVVREVDEFYEWLQEESEKFNKEVEAEQKKSEGNS